MTSSKSTKRALVSSALAILMCVAMLIGTTFAWFTDTASTGVNKIQAGNLDIAVEYTLDGEEWAVLDEAADLFGNGLFEPGYTRVAAFRISNKGTLALKYNMAMNIINETKGVNIAGEEFALSDYLKVKTSPLQEVNPIGDIMVSIAFDRNTSKAIGWNPETDFKNTKVMTNDQVLTAGQQVYFIMQVYMPETVGNEANAISADKTPSIDFGISFVATQATVEKDSYDNQYDKDASLDFVPVSNQTELQNAINAAAPGEDVSISLVGDVTIEETLYVIGKDVGANVGNVTIQANGKTLTSDKAKATRCLRIEYTDVEREITIIGAKVVSEGTQAGYNANENRGLALYDVKNATINLVNCEIEMKANDYAYAIKMINCDNVTLNLTGCTLTGANCIETNNTSGTNTINITDCVFNSNYAPNATYCGQGIQDKNGTGNTFNVKNTTFNGTNAQPWETSATTVINDLGGNVDNTTITKN